MKSTLVGKIILLRNSLKKTFFFVQDLIHFKKICVKNVYDASVQYFSYDIEGGGGWGEGGMQS